MAQLDGGEFLAVVSGVLDARKRRGARTLFAQQGCWLGGRRRLGLPDSICSFDASDIMHTIELLDV